MASALKIGSIAAALCLAATAVNANGAPAAYYPSLGYGQTPPPDEVEGPPYASVGEPVYQNGPPDDRNDDRGPPRGYTGDPAYGGYGYSGYGPGPGEDGYRPAEGDGRGHAEFGRHGSSSYGSSGYSEQSHGVYTSRSEQDYGYDSGWRAEGSRGEGRNEAYSGGAYSGDSRGYAGSSVERYDYDSGWRIQGREEGGGPPRDCRYARPDHPMPGPHEVCPAMDHRGMHLPDSFFADSGGVGPDFINGGGGGGGGFVVVGSGARAGAFASASASARVSVGVRARGHGGGHGGMKHGCGCGH